MRLTIARVAPEGSDKPLVTEEINLTDAVSVTLHDTEGYDFSFRDSHLNAEGRDCGLRLIVQNGSLIIEPEASNAVTLKGRR